MISLNLFLHYLFITCSSPVHHLYYSGEEQVRETLINEYAQGAHVCNPKMDYNEALKAEDHCFSRGSFLM
ncbi:MAG TPA: hypothetical protein K8V05_02140 [Butyricimonas virosa]|uniref:Uncharacterized protein n=1 Tax=Butyricimonas virosa TaxID=544645 RepID=A0A921H2G2_9BACT|nr:hypothetical protein [Butyricimonas virosa]